MPHDQMVQRGRIVRDRLLLTQLLEQRAELRDAGILDLDLVGNPPQNASSTNSLGSRFVENTMNWSNGTQISPLVSPR